MKMDRLFTDFLRTRKETENAFSKYLNESAKEKAEVHFEAFLDEKRKSRQFPSVYGRRSLYAPLVDSAQVRKN